MPWAKQTIIVQKTHAKDRDEASGIAKGFADRLYTSRETATSFRFRQKPPSKFVWGSYRTKSIPGKGVSIVYGRLKEAGALGTTDNELNEPFTPPGSSFAPSNAQELVRHKPLTPPVSMDTQEGSPTGFRKEAWEGFGDEFAPPGSSFRPTSGRRPATMDVAPDRVPPVAYEPQNLNSFYTGDERKYAMEKTAFERGFEKKAAARSEILNTTIDPLNWSLGIIASPLGVAVGPYSAEGQKKVNQRSWSNLIPGVAPYRLGRRVAGIGLSDKERQK